jgi:hypothetical protein
MKKHSGQTITSSEPEVKVDPSIWDPKDSKSRYLLKISRNDPATPPELLGHGMGSFRARELPQPDSTLSHLVPETSHESL